MVLPFGVFPSRFAHPIFVRCGEDKNLAPGVDLSAIARQTPGLLSPHGTFFFGAAKHGMMG